MDSATASDLSRFAGVFADGWTDDSIDRELPQIAQAVGLELRCVWEYADELGCGGHSNLCVLADGELRQVPEGLWELLVDANADAVVCGQAGGVDGEWPTLSELTQWGSGNLVVDDRSAADEDDG